MNDRVQQDYTYRGDGRWWWSITVTPDESAETSENDHYNQKDTP